MKIGILTFHSAHNYGAVLQAYCLQKKLEQLGHEVYIIDYRPQYLTRNFYRISIKCFISKSIKGLIKKWRNEPFLIKKRFERYNNFESFISNQLKLSPFINDEFRDFDAIFLGSDQIWNKDITGGNFDDIYFGGNAKCKIISYAASNKTKELNNEDSHYYTEQLKKFTAISVREELLAKLLMESTPYNIKTTLDPTLLAGKTILDNLVFKLKNTTPFIFIYELSSHNYTINIARMIAKKLKTKIIEIEGDWSAKRITQKDMGASPEKFISYIAQAECVVTTSFHGTALSIIYQKPFYAIRQNNSSDIRIESILKLLGLEDRFLQRNQIPSFKPINYNEVNKKLKSLQLASEDFIINSLQN